ncbi:hypothetical protein FOZ62_018548, partial [Perkinsus olseni]
MRSYLSVSVSSVIRFFMPSSSVAAEPSTPPFSLTGDRYDQSTYWGRFRRMLDQCDPTTLLH